MPKLLQGEVLLGFLYPYMEVAECLSVCLFVPKNLANHYNDFGGGHYPHCKRNLIWKISHHLALSPPIHHFFDTFLELKLVLKWGRSSSKSKIVVIKSYKMRMFEIAIYVMIVIIKLLRFVIVPNRMLKII